jgi:hypothetical protein
LDQEKCGNPALSPPKKKENNPTFCNTQICGANFQYITQARYLINNIENNEIDSFNIISNGLN